MQKLNVHRYANGPVAGYEGFIEPDDRSWILWLADDGHELTFFGRRGDTGGVESPAVVLQAWGPTAPTPA